MRTQIRLALLGTLIASCVGTAFADRPQAHHPGYRHALADLQEARSYLSKPAANERREAEEAQAVQKIDEAIDMVKHAATEDGIDLNERMDIDAAINGGTRFGKAHELLKSAKRDVAGRESDPRGERIQQRIMDKIQEAIDIVGALNQRHGERHQ